MIIPIRGNILIEPQREEQAFSSSQQSFEERGKVIELANELKIDANPLVNVGDFVYFDSWQAAKFKDSEGKEIWLVNIDAVRAVENGESSLPE